MKSIYSLEILQRILDHWGMGKITDVTYFGYIGAQLWRHWIETNQGEFELYSYAPASGDYARPKILEFLKKRDGKNFTSVVHSFDRCHRLRQLTQKYQISLTQIANDFKPMIGQTISSAYCGYGAILNINFANKFSLESYGHWNIQKTYRGQAKILADWVLSSDQELRQTIGQLETLNLKLEKFSIQDDWVELFFSQHLSIHIQPSQHYPIAEIFPPSRRGVIKIYDERQIYYSRCISSPKC